MDSFKNKVAIITGGASGIGKALCHELADRGAVVIVADINAEGAQEVVSYIEQRGGRAHAQHTDVSREDEIFDLVNQTLAQHKCLDYMFNNAGITVTADARDLSLEHWRRVIDVNLWAVIYGTMAAYAVMTKQGFGHIINTASLAGLLPFPTNTPYSTSKHAVVGLSLSLRAEAADLGIKVSVVCPGYVQSGINQAATILNVPREKVLPALPFKLMDSRTAARRIADGVSRNCPLIVFPLYARLLWWLYRLNVSFINPLAFKTIRDLRRARKTAAS